MNDWGRSRSGIAARGPPCSRRKATHTSLRATRVCRSRRSSNSRSRRERHAAERGIRGRAHQHRRGPRERTAVAAGIDERNEWGLPLLDEASRVPPSKFGSQLAGAGICRKCCAFRARHSVRVSRFRRRSPIPERRAPSELHSPSAERACHSCKLFTSSPRLVKSALTSSASTAAAPAAMVVK